MRPGAAGIRPMTEADVPAVDALEKALFPVDAWPTYMFYDELSQPDTRTYYVAVDALGTVIGYAGVMCVPPIADVQTIAVVPEREGQGIGTELLATLIEEARAFGARDVLLEVRADNPRAQRLYGWFGFEQIHIRPRYYRDGADALIMQLVLANWTGVPARRSEAIPAPHNITEETQ
ncbi:ribosomal protein S18-alanine N-acetyltransferase [Arthrobacter sp. I2-34]|uniref:Ribosomal protein S18-alanine N-acetyltransferase n=1 Tax=Arthrobacter hankyongi TaxID=2904801 RepID=A0ABS9L551_9MICC|nr:ribosomal protein S18-alanine N-acetyltransferase [Arthrobacter hankyongi]MCG2621703.1 ribosomal protein S18-alanine N-acetyltransferase [Arthrobacter hankyongi]